MATSADRPARLVLLYAQADASLAYELERLLRAFEARAAIDTWSPRRIMPGPVDSSAETDYEIARADIVLLLISADFLASQQHWLALALDQARRGTARVIPVLLRPTALPPALRSLVWLPSDGRPVTAREDRDDAFLDVLKGVQNVLEEHRRPEAPPPARGSATAIPIHEIFRIDGPPDITFVEPVQFDDIQEELKVMGRGLVVEGPSKIGKSTALRKALSQQSPRKPAQWFDGKLLSAVGPDADETARFEQVLKHLVAATLEGHVLIDDFHYVAEPLKRKLALRMKRLADEERPRAKVTLIGINPVGYSLSQLVPDITGRYHIVRMDRQPDAKLAELVGLGERAAGVRFRELAQIINEADGSFYITQLLCYHLLRHANVSESQATTVDVKSGPPDVMDAIRDDLYGRYHDQVRDFAAHDEAPPPRGAGLALLWLLSRSRNGDVQIQEAINRYPAAAAAFEWLRASNLLGFFKSHGTAKELLYYNPAAATLSIEDPQLKFFLRKLDWEQLARASGHVNVQFHLTDGPILTPSSSLPVAPPAVVTSGSRAVHVLHLSDLHIATDDQATLWYAQLAADLRQQGCERLDALVVSGDVANLATPGEYGVARQLLAQIMNGFGLAPSQLVLVPGNHDVNWLHAQDAYRLHKRARYAEPLVAGTYVEHGSDVVEVRDDAAYKLRFRHFADFYRAVKAEDYPLEYNEQGLLVHLPDHDLTFLGLNSAWQIDHHFRDRAGVHPNAVARALLALGAPSGLRIAVWHHPVQAAAPDCIRDAGFLQQLAVAGFRLALHGHVHQAANQLYRYDVSPGGRRIDLVASGTFGAPTHQWVPGYPLQYNLLRITSGKVVVETRRREEVGGAWAPDARWLQGPGADPVPRYELAL